MIYLNLLSDQKKEELKKKLFFEIITNVLEMLLAINIAVAIILLVAKIVLQNNFNETVSQSTLITTSYSAINQEIDKVNRELKLVDKLYKNAPLWSDLLMHLSKATPTDVNIRNASFNTLEKTASISGFALTRSGLLELIKNLESTNMFEKIESPISNIFERTNINFGLSANINLKNLLDLHTHP